MNTPKLVVTTYDQTNVFGSYHLRTDCPKPESTDGQGWTA